MTEVKTIEERINEVIIDKLGVQANEIIPTATFRDDLGADSLDLVELIMEFEKVFNIKLPDEEAENIKTVGEAIAIVKRKLNDIAG